MAKSAVFIAVCILGLLTCSCGESDINETIVAPVPKLPHFTGYSSQRFEPHHAAGKPVLIYYFGNWGVGADPSPSEDLFTREVWRLAMSAEVLMMQDDLTDADPRVIEYLPTTQLPAIIIYPADESQMPIVLSGKMTETMLIDAIGRL
ncbi:hypothetical protein LOC67_23925 [Stieleria sp. JC731]|uniref:hypothetical protein n=1 Tax=Pirellulaceae TaxID=2691357 RepID=UPI001E308A4A|nr:hypothetical protein [Stieleria sp. JC731]MCC9603610.1 hypothetical protein [Stieleria sp. JC731]